MSKRTLLIIAAAVIVIGGGGAWYFLSRPKMPEGLASGNARLEANMVYIAAKYPGRLAEVLVNEGDTVEAGQTLARLDTSALEAQLREAQAQIVAAEDTRKVALAQIAVRKADYVFASQQSQRSNGLLDRGAV